MAEKAEKPKKKREIKDAGHRTVLMGAVIDGLAVVKSLPQAQGLKFKTIEEAKHDKDLKAIIEKLGLNEEDELTVWVKVGQVKAPNGGEEAIVAALGGKVPGIFRTPPSSGWRGEIEYVVPAQVSLDVVVRD